MVTMVHRPALMGRGNRYTIHAFRWAAFDDVHGEGLLLHPEDAEAVADIVAIPDAGMTPEQLVGLEEGVPTESQYARRLVEAGCCVVVPMLLNREEAVNGNSNREWIYRSTYELGRHVIGYELQKILSIIAWFSQSGTKKGIGAIGWGDGGMLALYAAAVDERIDAAAVSGYFNSRQTMWLWS